MYYEKITIGGLFVGIAVYLVILMFTGGYDNGQMFLFFGSLFSGIIIAIIIENIREKKK